VRVKARTDDTIVSRAVQLSGLARTLTFASSGWTKPGVTETRTWGSYEKITMRRRRAAEEDKR
jgi:hypothetical protein